MYEDNHADETRDPAADAGGGNRRVWPSEPPVTLDDTQPVLVSSPDDTETAELPGELGEPTIAWDRVPKQV